MCVWDWSVKGDVFCSCSSWTCFFHVSTKRYTGSLNTSVYSPAQHGRFHSKLLRPQMVFARLWGGPQRGGVLGGHRGGYWNPTCDVTVGWNYKTDWTLLNIEFVVETGSHFVCGGVGGCRAPPPPYFWVGAWPKRLSRFLMTSNWVEAGTNSIIRTQHSLLPVSHTEQAQLQ